MKVKKYSGSIRKRLTWIIVLVTSITTFIGYSSFLSWYMNDQYEKALSLSETIANVLSQDFAKVILLNEVSVAAEISTKLQSFQRVNSMVLYKKDSTPIYQYSKDNRSFKVAPLIKKELRKNSIKDDNFKLYTSASYLGTELGIVQLNLKIDTLWDVAKKNITMILSLYIFMLFLSFLLSLYFAKKFTQPILKLVTLLEKVELSHTKREEVTTQENNEFGKLYAEINLMLLRIENAHKEHKIAAVAFEIQNGMTITDANHKILKINKAFTKITGYQEKEALGQTPSLLKSGLQDEAFYKKMRSALEKNHYWSGEIYNKHKNGSIFLEHLTIQSVLDDNGKVIYYIASFVDISQQKETENKLRYLEQYDSLTGLMNKDFLLSSLKNYTASPQKKWAALLSFNLKDFKMINDVYGHVVGDMLLQKIALKLKENFPNSEVVSRVAADGFALFFTNLGATKKRASLKTKQLAQEIMTQISESFFINTKTVHTSGHIGISLFLNTQHDAYSLLRESESALNQAKSNDEEYAYFDVQAQEIAQAHVDMYSQLRLAIKEHQFELLYQLQFKGDVPYAAEALIRWNHPHRGVISPLDFIPVAEKTGLIIPIGLWVIQEACRELQRWSQDPIKKEWVIAVNISAKQFKKEHFVEEIRTAVIDNNIKFSALKIELTESIIADDLDLVIEKMNRLQKMGIKTSLDDFGTGYSSLEYLKKLPLDQIKIDQSFVRNMLNDKRDVAIIKSIILIGEALELEVIAEGIETKEHLDLLKELGCNHFQGYYFARPQKASSLALTLS